LRAEHDLILHALEATDEAAWRLERGHLLEPQILPALMQFLSFFVHRSHRDKEEELLLPALQEKGFPDDHGCIAGLLSEHAEIASLFQKMVSAAEAYRLQGQEGLRWAQTARKYATAMRSHIWREEQMVFGEARRLLEPAESEALAREFENIDARAQRAGLTELMSRFEHATSKLRK